MKITPIWEIKKIKAEFLVLPVYQKSKKLDKSSIPLPLYREFSGIKGLNDFKADEDSSFTILGKNNDAIFLIGLGERKNVSAEKIRRGISTAVKEAKRLKTKKITISKGLLFLLDDPYLLTEVAVESALLSIYSFDKYREGKTKQESPDLYLDYSSKSVKKSEINNRIRSALIKSSAVNLCRDMVAEVPNVMTSTYLASFIEKDSKKSRLKRVKIKVLKKRDIIREKMNLLLSVNEGSAFEPRFLHLTYTPKNLKAKTKHIALIGKGLTYDTGGYSLKPATSLTGMKEDMGGAATVYAAFKAAVQLESKYKISCFIPITDNAINSQAVKPDAVVFARSKKSVEIVNTDAEGRLILADAIDYAQDFKPDEIIDAATLTGAVLVALGSEIAGIMGNNQTLIDNIIKASKSCDENIWQLPMFQEWKKDLKSKIADIKNSGSNRNAGSEKGALFLESFVKNSTPWVHLDIAGTVSNQVHLPYCPQSGGSGLIVRTLISYLIDSYV